MNRIEERLAALKEEGKKAFITYTTAGLPDYDTTKKIMSAQEKAGIDINRCSFLRSYRRWPCNSGCIFQSNTEWSFT